MGPVMTSLNMRGFHISLLDVSGTQFVELLDQPTSAPGWPAPYGLAELPGQSIDWKNVIRGEHLQKAKVLPSFCLLLSIYY